MEAEEFYKQSGRLSKGMLCKMLDYVNENELDNVSACATVLMAVYMLFRGYELMKLTDGNLDTKPSDETLKLAHENAKETIIGAIKELE